MKKIIVCAMTLFAALALRANCEVLLANKLAVPMYAAPDGSQALVSQVLYGSSLIVMREVDNEWVFVQSRDGYQGYVELDSLLPDNPIWRAGADEYQVCARMAFVYKRPMIASATVNLFSYSTRIHVIESCRKDKRWVHIMLADGSTAWMMWGDIEKIRIKSVTDVLELSKIFLGTPYLWGGVSSLGYDCSGFVQMLGRQMGYLMKRDACQQADDPGLVVVARADIQPGDFIYFGENDIDHVALYLGQNQIIHASVVDDTPRLVISDLDHLQLYFNCVRRVPKQVN